MKTLLIFTEGVLIMWFFVRFITSELETLSYTLSSYPIRCLIRHYILYTIFNHQSITVISMLFEYRIVLLGQNVI